MKILAIGDFHGKFPKKLQNLAKEVDIILCTGDYSPFSLVKEFFKYCYKKKDVELWEFVGKSKYKQSTLRDFQKGKNILNSLNNMQLPVFTTLGNSDCFGDDIIDIKKPRGKKFWKWSWDIDKFFKRELKNKKYKSINRIDYKAIKFNDFVLIGARGGSFPGHVKSKAYKKHRCILDTLFNKYKKEKIIFLSHIVPYQTKLDKITAKKADKQVLGKHYGSKLIRRIIDKHKPVLNLCGHMHENQGKDKLGKTLIVNPGAALDGKAAIIDFPEDKKAKIKVRFVR